MQEVCGYTRNNGSKFFNLDEWEFGEQGSQNLKGAKFETKQDV